MLYPRISELDLNVCYLVKLEIPVGRIAVLLSVNSQAISNKRKRLYEKLTQEKGSAQDFDKFINGLMEAVDFIKERETPENESDTDEEIENGANGKTVSTSTSQTDEKEIKLDEEIKIDIDFE